MTLKRIAFLVFVVFFTVFHSCKKDEETTPSTTGITVTTTDPARTAAVSDYNTNYLGSVVTSTEWTGNTGSCSAGRCSQATANAVINRINYFRRMVGLNDDCQMDTSFYQQEQEAALMLSANNQLSHSPASTWSCYTTGGYNGCASSNLALGYHSVNAINAFIFDDGSGNEAVGHRRWILHTNKKYFSYGSTSNAMALYVFRNTTNTAPPSFIAYPPKGYVPYSLVPARWSFSIPGAGFSSATVTMTGPGGTSIPVTIISRAVGYGDNSIVWTASGINTSSTSDVAYTVTVSGITGATQSSYTYTTTIFHP